MLLQRRGPAIRTARAHRHPTAAARTRPQFTPGPPHQALCMSEVPRSRESARLEDTYDPLTATAVRSGDPDGLRGRNVTLGLRLGTCDCAPEEAEEARLLEHRASHLASRHC